VSISVHPAARRFAVLAGGVGGARFTHGLVHLVPPREVTVIGNVGDDFEPYGLHVSPDLDTVLYTLAGMIDDDRGWGVRGDSPRALEQARMLGDDAWFWLGDLDLGLHLARAARLRRGERLSEAMAALCLAAGVETAIVPVTDDRLRTILDTPDGALEFQEYYVHRQHRDDVLEVRFDGADRARPAPGVLEALAAADTVLIAPSNPFISIGPILAVRGVREVVASRREAVVAVSPIVGGQALRGPAAAMLRTLGHEVNPLGVARLYADVASALVIDRADEDLAPAIEAEGLRPIVADAVMTDHDARRALAAAAIAAAGAPA
jgi:LPPG:FO 2-phospho-L-lactate transferase